MLIKENYAYQKQKKNVKWKRLSMFNVNKLLESRTLSLFNKQSYNSVNFNVANIENES